jgi:hypothetical protein
MPWSSRVKYAGFLQCGLRRDQLLVLNEDFLLVHLQILQQRQAAAVVDGGSLAACLRRAFYRTLSLRHGVLQ